MCTVYYHQQSLKCSYNLFVWIWYMIVQWQVARFRSIIMIAFSVMIYALWAFQKKFHFTSAHSHIFQKFFVPNLSYCVWGLRFFSSYRWQRKPQIWFATQPLSRLTHSAALLINWYARMFRVLFFLSCKKDESFSIDNITTWLFSYQKTHIYHSYEPKSKSCRLFTVVWHGITIDTTQIYFFYFFSSVHRSFWIFDF